MRFRAFPLSILVTAAFASRPSLAPGGPLVAQASGIFRADSLRLPATPADVLRLHREGDANLAFGAMAGRWIVDRMGEGRQPDEFLYRRMLAGFSWDEAGAAQLVSAGVDKGVLRALAMAKPLGLSQEGQDRLIKAGLDSRIAVMLGAQPVGTLPAMRTMADQTMGGMMAGNPMANNPAFKAQIEAYQQKIAAQMASQFRTEEFRRGIWDRIVDNWRSRIQVGANARAMLAPVGIEISNAQAKPAGADVPGGFGATATANDFLRSTPLAVTLGAAEVLAVINSRSTALIRATDPKDVESFRFEDVTHFLLRRNPSDLVLMRLQDDNGTPTARVTKGTFLGREFRPADEPVAVDTTQDGEVWTVRPKGRLAPGPYAFMMGGQSVVFVPFIVK